MEVVDEPWGPETGLLAAVGAFQGGDPLGALEQVVRVLEDDSDNAGARDFLNRLAPEAERKLEDRLAPLDSAPHMVVPLEELHTVPLDAQACFVVSRVDGKTSMADLCHLSGLSRLDTLRALAKLLDEGVLAR